MVLESPSTPSSDTAASKSQPLNSTNQNEQSKVDDNPVFADSESQNVNEDTFFNCRCGRHCSLDDFTSGNCDNYALSKNCAFPYLNTENLPEQEKQRLIARLEKNFQDIHLEYASLTAKLRKSLRQRQITPAMLADCLMDVQSVPPTAKNEQLKLRDHYRDIKSAEDITGAFEILRNYSSFFDYGIIELIVQNCGCDEVKEKLISYKDSFEHYCKCHVFECPIYSQKNSNSSDVVVKLEEIAELERYTLKSLKQLEVRLAEMLGITNRTLRVCDVEKGCLQITFQIPSIFEEAIFPLSVEVEHQLVTLGITNLSCGEYHFQHSKLKVCTVVLL